MATILLNEGFTFDTNQPADNRTVFDTIVDRNALPAVASFEGLVVYVKATQLLYVLTDGDNPGLSTSWDVVGTEGGGGIDSLAGHSVTELDDVSTAGSGNIITIAERNQLNSLNSDLAGKLNTNLLNVDSLTEEQMTAFRTAIGAGDDEGIAQFIDALNVDDNIQVWIGTLAEHTILPDATKADSNILFIITDDFVEGGLLNPDTTGGSLNPLDQAKLDRITVLQDVNLDTIEADTAANNDKADITINTVDRTVSDGSNTLTIPQQTGGGVAVTDPFSNPVSWVKNIGDFVEFENNLDSGRVYRSNIDRVERLNFSTLSDDATLGAGGQDQVVIHQIPEDILVDFLTGRSDLGWVHITPLVENPVSMVIQLSETDTEAYQVNIDAGNTAINFDSPNSTVLWDAVGSLGSINQNVLINGEVDSVNNTNTTIPGAWNNQESHVSEMADVAVLERSGQANLTATFDFGSEAAAVTVITQTPVEYENGDTAVILSENGESWFIIRVSNTVDVGTGTLVNASVITRRGAGVQTSTIEEILPGSAAAIATLNEEAETYSATLTVTNSIVGPSDGYTITSVLIDVGRVGESWTLSSVVTLNPGFVWTTQPSDFLETGIFEEENVTRTHTFVGTVAEALTATLTVTNSITGPAAGYTITEVLTSDGITGDSWTISASVALNPGYVWETEPDDFSETGVFTDADVSRTHTFTGEVRLFALTSAVLDDLTHNGAGATANLTISGDAGTPFDLALVTVTPAGWLTSGALGATSGVIPSDGTFETTVLIPATTVTVDRTAAIRATNSNTPSNVVTTGLFRQQHTMVVADGDLMASATNIIIGTDLNFTVMVTAGDPDISVALYDGDPGVDGVLIETVVLTALGTATFASIDVSGFAPGDYTYFVVTTDSDGDIVTEMETFTIEDTATFENSIARAILSDGSVLLVGQGQGQVIIPYSENVPDRTEVTMAGIGADGELELTGERSGIPPSDSSGGTFSQSAQEYRLTSSGDFESTEFVRFTDTRDSPASTLNVPVTRITPVDPSFNITWSIWPDIITSTSVGFFFQGHRQTSYSVSIGIYTDSALTQLQGTIPFITGNVRGRVIDGPRTLSGLTANTTYYYSYSPGNTGAVTYSFTTPSS